MNDRFNAGGSTERAWKSACTRPFVGSNKNWPDCMAFHKRVASGTYASPRRFFVPKAAASLTVPERNSRHLPRLLGRLRHRRCLGVTYQNTEWMQATMSAVINSRSPRSENDRRKGFQLVKIIKMNSVAVRLVAAHRKNPNESLLSSLNLT